MWVRKPRRPLGAEGSREGPQSGFPRGHLSAGLTGCRVGLGSPRNQPHLQRPCGSSGRTDHFSHLNTIVKSWRGTNPLPPPPPQSGISVKVPGAQGSGAASGFHGENGPSDQLGWSQCRGRASWVDRGLRKGHPERQTQAQAPNPV